MKDNERIIKIAYKYVFAMSKSKKYNPQTIANTNFFKNNEEKDIISMLQKPVKEFCSKYKCDKIKDFVYKNDYFTPRKMYLISPAYYIYYTYIVFKLSYAYLKGKARLDFSRSDISVFYSGILVLKEKIEKINENAIFNKSYLQFQTEISKYKGKSAFKIDIQNFFDNIEVCKLINKLRKLIDEKEIVDDLEFFLKKCDIYTLPQLHYSIASSILSQFYLIDFDKKMEQVVMRDKLHIIRFVDDMYIIHLDEMHNIKKDNSLLNEISYFLWQESLSLNTRKTQILSAEKFKNECKIMFPSCYEYSSYSTPEFISEKVKEIVDDGNLIKLVQELCFLEKTRGIDLKKYKEIIDKYISIEGENSKKILNYLIFSKKWEEIADKDMIKIVDDWKFILFNPNQFTILYILVYRYLENKKVINEKGKKIKEILNYLFLDETFAFRDVLIANSYLLQSNFKHENLIKRIEKVNKDYSLYINKYLRS